MRAVWLALGMASLGLAALGVALPLLPATPFVLLAAFFFARSSPSLHRRLLESPTFGGAIRDWQERRAISRKGKFAAVSAMALSLALSVVLGVEALILGGQALTLGAVAAFVLTRNSA